MFGCSFYGASCACSVCQSVSPCKACSDGDRLRIVRVNDVYARVVRPSVRPARKHIPVFGYCEDFCRGITRKHGSNAVASVDGTVYGAACGCIVCANVFYRFEGNIVCRCAVTVIPDWSSGESFSRGNKQIAVGHAVLIPAFQFVPFIRHGGYGRRSFFRLDELSCVALYCAALAVNNIFHRVIGCERCFETDRGIAVIRRSVGARRRIYAVRPTHEIPSFIRHCRDRSTRRSFNQFLRRFTLYGAAFTCRIRQSYLPSEFRRDG